MRHQPSHSTPPLQASQHLSAAAGRGVVLLLLLLLLPMTGGAQIRFGYFSQDSVLHSMPAYLSAQTQLTELRRQYDSELSRAEEEFNKKYEEFLDGQSEFAPIILQKRQTELQQILDKNLAFKAEARRLLQQAEEELMAPLLQTIDSLLRQIGEEGGYAFILNTDGGHVPFIDPGQGDNLTPVIQALLQ